MYHVDTFVDHFLRVGLSYGEHMKKLGGEF